MSYASVAASGPSQSAEDVSHNASLARTSAAHKANLVTGVSFALSFLLIGRRTVRAHSKRRGGTLAPRGSVEAAERHCARAWERHFVVAMRRAEDEAQRAQPCGSSNPSVATPFQPQNLSMPLFPWITPSSAPHGRHPVAPGRLGSVPLVVAAHFHHRRAAGRTGQTTHSNS